LLDEILWFTI